VSSTAHAWFHELSLFNDCIELLPGEYIRMGDQVLVGSFASADVCFRQDARRNSLRGREQRNPAFSLHELGHSRTGHPRGG
jgi:hypothetical protein